MTNPDVVVVGAGPAGLAAAGAAAGVGASVVVIDEYDSVGGQYLKAAASSPGHPAPTRADRAADRMHARLVSRLGHGSVEVRTGALLWGVFDGACLVVRNGRNEELHPEALVVATGAVDRPLPFPGWTLPGVMTAGAAQTLVKRDRVAVGERVLLAGSGPFLLPVAEKLGLAGSNVVLAEATGPTDWLGLVPAGWRMTGRVREAIGYLRSLKRLDVTVRTRAKVVRVGGEGRVEEATIARVDDAWRADPGSEEIVPVDAVAVGYGFVPSVELAEHLGCELQWNGAASYWQVRCDDEQRTTREDVFAAGEVAGVGGAHLAEVEGTIAGIGAAEHAGRIDAAAARRARQELAAMRRRLRRFSAALEETFAPRPGLWEKVDDNVTVCRCEEVSAGTIRRRVGEGCTTPKQIKDWTRAQMGLCQGRMCAPAVARLIADEMGVPVDTVPRASVRPPLKPVPISALAELDEESAE